MSREREMGRVPVGEGELDSGVRGTVVPIRNPEMVPSERLAA